MNQIFCELVVFSSAGELYIDSGGVCVSVSTTAVLPKLRLTEFLLHLNWFGPHHRLKKEQ